MILKNKELKYYFKSEANFNFEQTKRATIIFDRVDDCGWKFCDCIFAGLTKGNPYSENDWIFLGKINDKIQELLKKLNS